MKGEINKKEIKKMSVTQLKRAQKIRINKNNNKRNAQLLQLT